jgi:hypothetical protein
MTDEQRGYVRGLLVAYGGIAVGLVLDRLMFGSWIFASWP